MSKTINPVTVSPDNLQIGDHLGFKIIAVISYGGGWAAYRGLTDWSDAQVADQGDKISEEAASALFYAPVAAGLSYRR